MRYSLQPTSRQPPAANRSRASAFTLLEMSIVLVIIATVVAGGITIFSSSLKKQSLAETQAKISAIQQALYNFRIATNRLPCPADVTLALTNAYFGYEAGTLSGTAWNADTGSCLTKGTYVNDALTATAVGSVAADFANTLTATGNTTIASASVTNMNSVAGIVVGMAVSGNGIPPGDMVSGVAGSTVTLAVPATITATGVKIIFLDLVQGMAPTAALGLPDDDAVDGWGNRIMYMVDARFTAVGALTGSVIPVTDTGSRITVEDQSDNPKTTTAAYVLVSFGPDAHGAWPRYGAAIGARINSSSDNADELKDCDCSGTAASNHVIPAGIFVQKQPTQSPTDAANIFDDVVAYGTRSDLRSPTE